MAEDTKKAQLNKSADKAMAKVAKYFYSVGRRKTAAARVKLFPNGTGKVTINDKDYKEYFPYFKENQNLELPFTAIGEEGKYDVEIKVKGGGPASQGEACRLGIARNLLKVNEDNKAVLRTEGYLTRDPRAKERKKPGLKRARKSPQWSKR